MSAPPTALPPGLARALQGAVFDWWSGGPKESRDALPWRHTRDPWAVLVSEMMLAQTSVGRVTARFPPFLERFPTPTAMAQVPAGEVVRAWSGLGYNRRALHLHALARRLADEHAGRVPDELAVLLGLPGVGPYTARAVLCFAYDRAVGVVDTNVGRILARAVTGRCLHLAEAQRLADALVARRRARDWGLALMDLGALCCRARRPDCAHCPLAAGCCAYVRQQEEDASAPDPAVGSAATSTPQAPFAGSDRQLRGRLLRAACAGAIAPDALARVAGVPEDPERAARLARRLVGEGLLVRADDGGVRLP